MTVKGVGKFALKLKSYGKAALPAVAAELFREGEQIMAKSKAPGMVPVDTGALRSTGHVQKPTVSGATARVVLGYGGPAAPYAFVVHEEIGLKVKSGTARYLSIPASQAAPGMARRVGRGVAKRLAAVKRRK